MTAASLVIWEWIDYRFTPNLPALRYRKAKSFGMDDFGNAVMLTPGSTPYSPL